MVDVSEKSGTHRTAIASGVLRMRPTTLARIHDGTIA
ncbi:MAG: cyclic pyranopterin monophosphate synthase MoaC, partial [Betaproteobacteria bacterium]|nr:cyclic pyranopterin monophosphate synthase MoaC [Betaproteobacteria bacterium]